MELFSQNKKMIIFQPKLVPFMEIALYDFLIFNKHYMRKALSKNKLFDSLLGLDYFSYHLRNNKTKIFY